MLPESMPPRQVGANRNVTDELALHSLMEQAVELLQVLLVRRATVILGEVKVPVALDSRTAVLRYDHVVARRKEVDAGEQGAVREHVLEREVLE